MLDTLRLVHRHSLVSVKLFWENCNWVRTFSVWHTVIKKSNINWFAVLNFGLYEFNFVQLISNVIKALEHSACFHRSNTLSQRVVFWYPYKLFASSFIDSATTLEFEFFSLTSCIWGRLFEGVVALLGNVLGNRWIFLHTSISFNELKLGVRVNKLASASSQLLGRYLRFVNCVHCLQY